MTTGDEFTAQPAAQTAHVPGADQPDAPLPSAPTGVDHELAMISRSLTRSARRAARTGDAAPQAAPRHLLLSCMKNEGATVLEWVAFHRVIGFDHFLIYTNDCEDGTDLIWKRLDQMGLASFQDNPPKRPVARHKPQVRGLIRAMTHPAYLAADWVMMLDADEFLNIHAGDGRVSDLLAQRTDADCFMINWRLFGSSGVQDFKPGFVTEQFLHGADPDRVSRSHALAPKSIFRPGRFSKPNIHRPGNPVDGGERIYATASGQTIPRSWGAVSRHGGYSHAQINHYSVQSMDMLLLKFARGFAVQRQMESPQDYLAARDFNHCQDTSVLRHRAEVRAEYDRLIADPVLARLQAAAVDWRQKKLAEALAQPELSAMKAALVAAQAALGAAGEKADAA